MFNWFRRKKKIEGTGEIEKHSLDFLDSITGEPFVLSENNKLRRSIDLDLFTKIQRALALKNARKFYRTEKQIANKFSIGTTTVSLIRKATEARRTLRTQFGHYKELRKQQSKPEKYNEECKNNAKT